MIPLDFFQLNYVAESNKGCIDSLNKIIEVIDPPIASYSALDSGCGPLSVDFVNNSSGKYVNYVWDLGFINSLGLDSLVFDTVPVLSLIHI